MPWSLALSSRAGVETSELRANGLPGAIAPNGVESGPMLSKLKAILMPIKKPNTINHIQELRI
ncbi:hypothetical protein D9M68_931690 [compost metagenome]